MWIGIYPIKSDGEQRGVETLEVMETARYSGHLGMSQKSSQAGEMGAEREMNAERQSKLCVSTSTFLTQVDGESLYNRVCKDSNLLRASEHAPSGLVM